jgi:hypothetical protein
VRSHDDQRHVAPEHGAARTCGLVQHVVVTGGWASASTVLVLLAACGGTVQGVTGTGDATDDVVEDRTVADGAPDVTAHDAAPTDSTTIEAAEQDAPLPGDAGASDVMDAGRQDASDAADGQESGPPDAATCPLGQVLCDAGCIDPEDNTLHCGATPGCGLADGSPGFDCTPFCGFCAGAQCQLGCSAGLVVCHGECVDPKTNTLNCGAGCSCIGDAAGVECQPGQVCDQGQCMFFCPPGDIVCDGGCVPEGGVDGGCP